MRAVFDVINRAATKISGGVLICGEQGSGRSLLAHELHRRAHGAAAPFQHLDCADLPTDAETELFGTPVMALPTSPAGPDMLDPIAPTSIVSRAQGGSLYLAHVDALPSPVQWRLARMFESGIVSVAGTPQPVGLRVFPIASLDLSNRNPISAQERIRRDLFEQVASTRIDVPPLRQRREDIPALSEVLLRQECLALRKPPKILEPTAVELLAAMPWRGNVAELRAAMHLLAQTTPEAVIRLEDVLAVVRLDGAVKDYAVRQSLRDATRRFEREFIITTLERCKGRIGTAASTLGIQRPNLYRKMRALGIPLNTK